MEKTDFPHINAFVSSLEGRSVELFFASNDIQLRGFTFTVDIVDWNEEEKSFGIRPINQAPFVVCPYQEMVLLTGDRLIISGGTKGDKDEWAIRLECII